MKRILNQLLVFLQSGEFGDEFLDFLRLAFVREQRGVVGLDEDGVAQADDGDGRAVFGAGVEDDVARGVHVDEIGDSAIALGVGLEMPGERGPGTEVVPFKGAVRDDDVLRVLHEGEVDGDFFDGGIFLRKDLVQFRGRGRGLEPALAGVEHFRLMFLQTLGDGHERPDEHAGVPAVLAAVDVFEGAVEVRLFHKAFGAEEFKYSAIWKASLMPANVNGTAAIWRG